MNEVLRNELYLIRKRVAKVILPRHRIYVVAHHGDGDRFARLFRETWRRIPLPARRRILAHWRNANESTKSAVRFTPLIQLVEDLWDDNVFADVCGHGHFLRFYSEFIDRMPDAVVCDLIAHELAHVIQDAIGIHSIPPDQDGNSAYPDATGEYWGDELDIEVDADLTAADWGFSYTSIDEWAEDQGITAL